jgi:hypothetical protein
MTQVPCKIIFSDPLSSHQQEIIGIIDLSLVLESHSEWLTVESKSFQNNRIQEDHSIIHKSSIQELQILTTQMRLVVDKQTFVVYSNIARFFDGQEAVKI